MKKKFLTQLKKEMRGHPYEQRFLEEVEAHIEDLEADKQPIERMGEPAAIHKEFLNILHPWRALYFVSEALFVGLIMMPWGVFAIPILAGWLNAGMGHSQNVISLFLGPVLLSLFWFITYSLAWIQWKKIHPTTGLPFRLWAILVMTPVFIFLCVSFRHFTELGWDVSQGREPFHFVVIAILILNGLMAWLARIKTREWVISPKKPLVKTTQATAGVLFFFYMVTFILLRNDSSILVNTLFSPLGIAQFILQLIWSILFFGASDIVMAKPMIYSLGFILIFVAIHSLISMVQNKQWSWFKAGTSLWALSILLANPHKYDGELAFQGEFYPLSKHLEQEQMGPFYGLSRSMNADEGRLFRYKVHFEEGQLFVYQNSGREFRFDPEQIESTDFSKVENDAVVISQMPDEKMEWNERLTCENTDPSYQVPLDFNTWIWCDHLYWGDALLVSNPYALQITDLALSPDQKWLAIVIEEGAYDPEHVYLLNLEGNQ